MLSRKMSGKQTNLRGDILVRGKPIEEFVLELVRRDASLIKEVVVEKGASDSKKFEEEMSEIKRSVASFVDEKAVLQTTIASLQSQVALLEARLKVSDEAVTSQERKVEKPRKGKDKLNEEVAK